MISDREEEQLWTRALAFLERGRPGDVEHTRTALAYGKALLANEGGDPRVVIPALIFHDVGWSRVDFSDFVDAPPEAKKDSASYWLHMDHSVRIASDVLTDFGWDPESIRRITTIIAVHDSPEDIRALNDINATLVFEADWLDKYTPARQHIYFKFFTDPKSVKDLQRILAMKASEWFSTGTARKLLGELMSG